MATTTNGIIIPDDLAAGKIVALLRTAFNTQVQEAAHMADPLVNVTAMSSELKPGPQKDKYVGDSANPAFFLTVTADMYKNEARKIITQMDLPLEESGQEGRNRPLGNEEDLRAIYSEAYAQDYAKSVGMAMYGIDAREATPAGLAGDAGIASANKRLGTWAGELRGMYFRQSHVRRYSGNLTQAPVSLSRFMHPNTIILGREEADQPTWSATGGTWETNIATKLNALTAGQSLHTAITILRLIPLLENRWVQPVAVGGNMVWVLYVHKNIFNDLFDPSITDSYAEFFQSMANLNLSELYSEAFPYGSFVVSKRLIVVNDPKAPIIGVSVGNTITEYYKTFGRNDERSSVSEPKSFYCSLLFGLNAVVKHEPAALTYREQTDEHGKFKSIALTGAIGYNNVNYKNDDSTIFRNEGSALILSELDVAP